jgi:hypothetical protein
VLEEAKVRVSKPEVTGASASSGSVGVSVPIEGEQPEEWYGIFVDGPAGVTEYSDMPELRFGDGTAVTFSCPPDAIQRIVTHIRERVQAPRSRLP